MSEEPVKMVRITGELAKACGISPDAEPIPMDLINEVAEVLLKGLSRRVSWVDISLEDDQ